MKFPQLSNDHLNIIVKRCWKSQFTLLKNLSEEAKSLCCKCDLSQSLVLSAESCSAMKSECQRFVDSGLLSFDQ